MPLDAIGSSIQDHGSLNSLNLVKYSRAAVVNVSVRHAMKLMAIFGV